MALSEKTITEMRAGAAALAAHAGASGIDEEYMQAMIRTQQRAKWLKALEGEGRVKIEIVTRRSTNVKLDVNGERLRTQTAVRVGDNLFYDDCAELTGAFPSEVLVAQVAMALAAGEGEKEMDPASGRTTYLGEEVHYNGAIDMFQTRSRSHSWTHEEYHDLCRGAR